MGALAPLYLAGLAALSLPVIFHLVRRTPRDRQVFSSLMFLSPSPPRLTRKSRLDQILLLFLRLAALALLAAAFARPFLRETSLFAMKDLPMRRVAILLDVSASMQRGEVWRAAIERMERELNDLGPQDEAALFTFSDQVRTLVRFPSEQAGRSEQDSATAIRTVLADLKPGWGGTDLGAAVSMIAAEIAADADAKQSVAETQILVLSDFQKSASLTSLQAFEWPAGVYITPYLCAPSKKTNASLQLLPVDPDDASADPRVRISNAADSSGDQFFIRWSQEFDRTEGEGEVSVYVPPGQSRVVRLPRGPKHLEADRILLRGDDHLFDNEYFTVPPRKSEFRALFVSDDPANDPQGMIYYARLALANDPLRQVNFEAAPESLAGLDRAIPTRLFLITKELSETRRNEILAEVEQGAAAIIAPPTEGASPIAAWLPEATSDVVSPRRNDSDFLLLGTIEFSHPIFQPFAHPKYGDFTKIHFWRSRKLELKEDAEAKVIARFDNGDPAIIEKRIGKGYLFVFAAGWRPEDSELALSTKFVPIMTGIADLALGGAEAAPEIRVGEAMSLPAGAENEVTVRAPGGASIKLAAGETLFRDCDAPGIYTASWSGGEKKWAVNPPPAESETSPLDLAQLEQYGVEFAPAMTREERLERKRQELDIELEGRQKVWQWLLLGMMGILIAETFWAGRAEAKLNRGGRPSHV